MKKLKAFFSVIFLLIIFFYSAQIISGQINRISLDAIIEELPDLWWEGGWDKIVELNQYINQNLSDKQACARAQFWIACNYYANRDYERAIQEYEIVLGMYPEAWGECAKAQFEIGQVYLYRLYDYEQALEAYQKVLSEYPECEITAEAQRMQAYTYSKLENNAKAHEEYQKVWVLYPKFKLEVAKAYWENGELFFKESMGDNITQKDKEAKLKESLSNYKNAYLYCPADDVEVCEWIIDSIIRAFRFLDGNPERANAFIQYQRYSKVNDAGSLSTQQTEIYDPLADF